MLIEQEQERYQNMHLKCPDKAVRAYVQLRSMAARDKVLMAF